MKAQVNPVSHLAQTLIVNTSTRKHLVRSTGTLFGSGNEKGVLLPLSDIFVPQIQRLLWLQIKYFATKRKLQKTNLTASLMMCGTKNGVWLMLYSIIYL